MKRLASLFYVSVAIASIGLAAGDGTATTECTLEVEDGKSKNDTMYEKVITCTFDISYVHMGKNPSTELIRQTLTAYCGRRPQLQQCLDRLDEDARRCLDAIEQTRHRLYRQYKKAEVDAYCEHDGVDIVEAFRRSEQSADSTIVRGCIDDALAGAGASYNDGVNGFMLYTYAVMQRGIECLESHKGQGHDEQLDWVIASTTNLLNRTRCVKDDADVLCKTIVDSH